MKERNSTVAAFSTAFLLALILNFAAIAQTSETKNQPPPATSDLYKYPKAGRIARLHNDFKSALKNKKTDWILIDESNGPYGSSFLRFKSKSKEIYMFADDYETVEEAISAFEKSKSPEGSSIGLSGIPQEGFGDESILTAGDYERKGKRMNLTFRSGNYLVSLVGARDDVFSFGKVMSDTISEQKKSALKPLENQ